MTQSGFGFGPSFGDRRAVRVVRIARCGLFWMVEDGSGWRPLVPAAQSEADAKAAAISAGAGLVRVVSDAEVK